MRNLRIYSPEFLSPTQTAKLDQIVLNNRQVYIKTKWRKSFLSSFVVLMEIAFNQWIERIFNKTIQKDNSMIDLFRYYIHRSLVKFISFLGLSKSPGQTWLFKQTHLIREEVDMMMPALSPHQFLSLENIIANIKEEIKRLNRNLKSYTTKLFKKSV